MGILIVYQPGARAATQGLFLFDGLRQRVDFDYRYRGLSLSEEGTGSTRSTHHRFEEAYRFDINYAMLGPNLLLGGIGFETELNQMASSISGSTGKSSTTDGFQFLYDIYGTFLRYHPVSLRFFSNSKMNQVSREFAQNYEQTIYANGLSLHVRNKIVPFDVDYRWTTTETDGLTADYRRKNRSLMIDARHYVEQLSQTFLDLRFDDFRTLYESGLDDYEFLSSRLLLTNNLNWFSGKNSRRLASRLSYVEEEGTNELHGYDWSENLDWHFGRALAGTLYYSQSYTDRELNALFRKQGRASLRHQFLACIDTQLGFELLDTEQGDGGERDRSGDISIAYRKKLSDENYLHMQFYQRYGVVDRDFSSFAQTVVDESHTADTVVPIILDRSHVVSSGIVIRNADPAVRLDPYLRDVDYQVDQVGTTTLISILPGSDIADGTALLIDYNHLQNAQEEYAYINRKITASLGWKGAYRLYAGWEESLRSHLSGEGLYADANSDLREALFGFDGSWRRSTFGLEYKNRKAYYEDRQSIEAFYQWAQRLGKGVLTSGLGGYYASIEPGGSDGYWSNTLSVNSKYQAPVFKRGVLGLLAKYANTRSKANDRDDISLGVDFRHGYGKFMMTIDAEVDWRFIDSQQRREETVNLKISRHL